MKPIEVVIDKTRMNFKNREGFPLSMDISIDSAEDPSRINGSHSKRAVEFPGDGQTAQFFEEWANPSRVNPGADKRKPARIEVGGMPVFTGVAQLEEVSTGGNKYGRNGSGYKVGLVGNNATWFDTMRKQLVKDLGILPVHEKTSSYVSSHDNPDPDTDAFGYFLVRMKDWNDGANVQYIDLQPFMFIRPLLKEAFRLAGYTFSSSFFDTDLGKRLMLPVPLRTYVEPDFEEWTMAKIDEDNATALNSSTFTHITINGTFLDFDPSGRYNVSGRYQVPASGYYIIAVSISTVQTAFRARVNNLTILDPFTTPWPDTGTQTGEQGRVWLNAGDVVDLVAQSILPFAGFSLLHLSPDFESNEIEEFTIVDLAKYGNPEWEMGSLILGLTHAFGLVWNTDPDAYSVNVEPRDPFVLTYRDPDTTERHDGFFHQVERLDFSHKIDLSKDGAVGNETAMKDRYVLAWKTDSGDANLSKLDGKESLGIYDGAYQFPANRFREGETRISNPFFAKTLHLLDAEIKHDNSELIPQIPVFQDEEFGTAQDERGDFAPRLLYFAGRRSGLDGYVNLEDYGQYDFPAAFMVNYNDPSGYDPSLAFATIVFNEAIRPGLLQTFHLQHLKRIEVGKTVSEWVFWAPLDILNLDFRNKILIDGSLFLLQKIAGYRPQHGGSTETVLLLDAVPETTDILKISGPVTKGYIPLNQ